MRVHNEKPKGMIEVKHKENKHVFVANDIWTFLARLNILSVVQLDLNKVRVYIDGEEIPQPPEMEMDYEDPPTETPPPVGDTGGK
jgi:hypothetical protein